MTCAHCGSWQPYDPSAHFCANCGAPTTAQAAPATPQAASPDSPTAYGPGFEYAPRQFGQYPTGPVAAAGPPPRRNDWTRHPAVWAAVVAVVVAVGLVVGVLLFTGHESDPQAGGTPSPQGSAAATSTTSDSADSPTAATQAPPTRTVVVPPPVTQTVTSPAMIPNYGAGASVPGGLGSRFAASTQVDPSDYYADSTTVRFDSPSGNISCIVYNASSPNVQCTIASFDFTPPECPGGAGVIMYTTDYDSSIGCVSQTYEGAASVLPYGRSIVNGDLSCVSESQGVSCANIQSGSGFFLSRQSYDHGY